MNIDEKNYKKIVWIASYPKSGNTWVRCFLDCYVSRRPVSLNGYYEHFAFGDLHEPSYQCVMPWQLCDSPQWAWAAFRLPALTHMMASRAWMPIALKTHHANVKLNEFKLIPPQFTRGAIYIVRDPRDAIVSWSHHAEVSVDDAITLFTSTTSSIRNKTNGLGHYLQSWSEHIESWIEEKEFPITLVRYEDMISFPAKTFREILGGSGFSDIDEEGLMWSLQQSSFNNLRNKEKEDGFKEKKGGETFFRKGKVGGWKDVLTISQVEKIEESLGDVMVALDYKLKYKENKYA